MAIDTLFEFISLDWAIKTISNEVGNIHCVKQTKIYILFVGIKLYIIKEYITPIKGNIMHLISIIAIKSILLNFLLKGVVLYSSFSL